LDKKKILPLTVESYINRQDLKPLLREVSKQKGLLLVETSLKDGTEISIRL
jgi:hypothetical protein